MSKICYIFGASPIDDYTAIQLSLKQGDTIICADGGYGHMAPLGLACNWLVGDFDSQTDGVAEHVIRVKPEKDDTDLQLALEQGMALGYQQFVLYGVMGGRWDHSMATIQLLVWMTKQGHRVTILDGHNRMTALTNGTHQIPKDGYRYLSLFAYGACDGVTIQGCKYPLVDASLTDSYPLGVSNEIVKDQATVTLQSGVLLVIQSQ